MKSFRRVLFATDFSQASRLAFEEAIELSKDNGAELLIDGAIATLECTTLETFTAGDHDLFIGRVDSLEQHREGVAPLLYFRRRYLRVVQGSDSPVEGKPEG